MYLLSSLKFFIPYVYNLTFFFYYTYFKAMLGILTSKGSSPETQPVDNKGWKASFAAPFFWHKHNL